MPPAIVVDTSVFVSALISPRGGSRRVLRLCLQDLCQPVIGAKLFHEFEEVVAREGPFRRSPITTTERRALYRAFLSVCRWVNVYYLWRPNLLDESDNHVIELAIAAGAEAIVTHNVRDFVRGELRFPDIEILTPERFLKRERERRSVKWPP